MKIEQLIKIQNEAEEAHELKNCRSTCALSVGLGKSKLAINRIIKKLNSNPNAKIIFSSAREVYLDNFKLEMIKFGYEEDIKRIDFCCNKSLKNKSDIYDLIIIDESHKEIELYYEFISNQFNINPDIEILCLTGTPKKTNTDLYDLVPISIFKKMDLAIDDNLLNDYEIKIYYYNLDDVKRSVEIRTKKVSFFKTEKEHYNYLYNKFINRPAFSKSFSYELSNLKLFFNNLKSKELLAKRFLNEILKDKKTLVYAGTIEQAESFKKPTYHSKLNKEIKKKNYDDFFNDKFLHLINVEGLRESVSIPNLTNLLLLAPGASDTALEQKIGRGCRLALGEKATFIILCTKDTIEEKWLEKSLNNLKQDKITKYYL